jgi:hypothetical protein
VIALKIDFKKTLKSLYNPSARGFHLVDVPLMNYVMSDGKGDPNTSEDYRQVVEALYSISYGIKFAYKSDGFDHVVPPLEGLWWMDDMREFNRTNINQWEWTMMIMQPEWVTSEAFSKVCETSLKKTGNPVIRKVRFGTYHEGLAIQVLYIGPYDGEAQVIAEMHKVITDNGYLMNGKHHEIYLSDPRKTPPEHLKTILRQPVRRI